MIGLEHRVDAPCQRGKGYVGRVEREQIWIDDDHAIATLDQQRLEMPKSRDAADHAAHEHECLGAGAVDDDGGHRRR